VLQPPCRNLLLLYLIRSDMFLFATNRRCISLSQWIVCVGCAGSLQWLISPPPSPPVGWVTSAEPPPVVNEVRYKTCFRHLNSKFQLLDTKLCEHDPVVHLWLSSSWRSVFDKTRIRLKVSGLPLSRMGPSDMGVLCMSCGVCSVPRSTYSCSSPHLNASGCTRAKVRRCSQLRASLLAHFCGTLALWTGIG
jgi:hypothetical protein